MEVTMDIKQPVGNTAGFGWPSCCHISYWLAQGNIFLRSSAAFSFLGMNTALGYKRFEYHLERNGIPRAFFNTTSNHSFVTMEAFIHFLFGGVPNNRGDKYVPSENVKTMRQYVLSKITEVKTDANVNENPPAEETIEGGQAFDSISEITGDNNLQPLQVISNVERTEPANITSQPQSQEASIVVYIQTQEASENQPMESTAEQATFDNIRYTDPLPSFQQVGNPEPVPESVPEPEPTSDATCEVMASGFGGGQEGNKESFLQEELRTIPTIAEAEIPYCMHEEGNGHENCWICSKVPRKVNGAANVDADKPFRCETCNKTFPVSSHLKRHLKIHTGEKPHQCQQCGKRFALAQNLKLHMRVHTGEKPYSCTFCEKRFPGHSDLAKHLRTHTGERPYKCEHCDQSFASASGLRRHHLVHTGERPHSCPHCEKTFRRRWHMILHIRAHTGETPHSCHLCDKAYRDKTSLNKHIRDHLSGRLEEKQRLKEERAAVLAAKTLARSSVGLLNRRKRSKKKKAIETSEISSESPQGEQAEDVSAMDSGTAAGEIPNPKPKERPARKRSSKKGDNEPVSKRGRKKQVKDQSTAISSVSNDNVEGIAADSAVEPSVAVTAVPDENTEANHSNQGEKLQALADAASILATTLLVGQSEGEQATISTGDEPDHTNNE